MDTLWQVRFNFVLIQLLCNSMYKKSLIYTILTIIHDMLPKIWQREPLLCCWPPLVLVQPGNAVVLESYPCISVPWRTIQILLDGDGLAGVGGAGGEQEVVDVLQLGDGADLVVTGVQDMSVCEG